MSRFKSLVGRKIHLFNKKTENRGLIEIEKEAYGEDKKRLIHDQSKKNILAGIDYMPINTTVRLPKRKKKVAVQVISDYYMFRVEKYWENDGILFRGLNKIIEHVSQSGFTLEADDQKDIVKLENAMRGLLKLNGIVRSFPQYLKRGTHDIVIYGNSFMIKDIGKIAGQARLRSIKISDPLSMSALLNKDTQEILYYSSRTALRKRGDIEGQLQKTPSSYYSKYAKYAPRIFYLPKSPDIRYDVEEIEHMKYMDIPQSVISIPLAYPVIDDILAMRTIEDDILLLSYQYGHPLLHSTIDREGMTEAQMQVEAANLQDKINNMEGNGAITTSDRVKMSMLTPQGSLPNLIEFHNLFRGRIEKGIGVPDVISGEGAGVGRQTSETVEKSFWAYVNFVGETVKESTQLLIDEVWNRNVLGSADSASREVSPIKLIFNNADKNEQRTRQQHWLQVFQTGGITHGEYRKKLNLPADKTLVNKYSHDINADVANAAAKVAAKVKSQLSPTNQFGNQTKGTKKS